jgi:hypothetical protein
MYKDLKASKPDGIRTQDLPFWGKFNLRAKFTPRGQVYPWGLTHVVKNWPQNFPCRLENPLKQSSMYIHRYIHNFLSSIYT